MKTCIVCGREADRVVNCTKNNVAVSFCSEHASTCDNCTSDCECFSKK